MKYTAIFPSKDIGNAVFCLESLARHSRFCDQVIIVWDDVEIPGGFRERIHSLSREFRIAIYPIINQDKLDVYGMFNLGVRIATSDFVLLVNDDMYFPPDWDVKFAFLSENDFNTVYTFRLVEPGYVDVNARNLHFDFGQTLETFRKKDFDEFANKSLFESPIVSASMGWYMPVLLARSLFIKVGGYNTYPPFPFPHDVEFFELLEANGVIFTQINSYVYHFQRLSQRIALPDKLNLCCGADKRDGYLGVDVRDSDFNVDLSSGILPFPNGTFSEVLFRHALEHFLESTGKHILKEIFRVLKPGGYLTIYVPDLRLACQDLLSGANKYPNCAPAMMRIYGQNTSIELVHKWGYTEETLRQLLSDIGFHSIEDIPKNDHDEIALRAYV